MLAESLITMVRSWLRVPPGASVRRQNEPTTGALLKDNDYVSTIVDITVDDVCIGENPMTVTYDSNTPELTALVLEQINDEVNTIIKWAARDLAIQGFSVYKASINTKTNRLILMPDNRDYEFYLTTEKKVVAYILDDGAEKNNEKDLLVFINFHKEDLEIIDDKDKNKKLAFKINPCPMQLKNVGSAASALSISENAITKYRALISRPARWVNVDVGLSQGDTQSTVVDTIASAINAGSDSLTSTSEMTQFDDNIPVIPNRKGIGKPEIVESIPNANLKDVVDIEYNINKLCLMMRFPASYIDFSKELGQSAVSLIRSDLRYSKLCSTIRTKCEDTINDFIRSSEKYSKYNPKFTLTTIPTSEDSDVIDALSNYIDLSDKLESFLVIDDKQTSIHRLDVLQDMLNVVNSPSIKTWLDRYREFLTIEQSDEEQDSLENEDEEFDIPSVDREPSLEEPEEDNLEDEGDVEMIEPQSDEE